VYVTTDSAEATTGSGVLAQCEATIQEIECSFPLELHITIHEDSCAVVCEPPACPVNNIFCMNSVCSVCLPATVDFPIEQCQAFLQSCDPSDLGPMSTTHDELASGTVADGESSTNPGEATDTTGTGTTEGPSVDETAEGAT
jgi:hypothetical protein